MASKGGDKLALKVEDGTGVPGADSYASIDYLDSFWTDRAHSANSASWLAATQANKEGAAREATSYLDAVYNLKYRGNRRGNLQGLEWPRTGATSDAGWPMEDLPVQIQMAVAELAVRALVVPLAADADPEGSIKRKREKVGPLEEETEYLQGSSPYKRFGAVEDMLAPVLKKQLSWSWA